MKTNNTKNISKNTSLTCTTFVKCIICLILFLIIIFAIYLLNSFRNGQSYPLTVQRFLNSSLSGYVDSGENLKVSTCITSQTDRCLNTYNRLKDR